ncbi:MAG: EamA family transporter [Acidobacteriota bacterium]|nr:EamA family transporter [Acidobacteriota bacterium]
MPGTSHPPADFHARKSLQNKTRLFAVLTIFSNVAGNSFLTKGMQQLGEIGNSPLALIGALFHPLVAIGVVLLIVWTLTHMALLSWADLSYVMPVTAMGYVVTAFAARLFLGENVSPVRWTGIVLVTAGVTLVGRTAAATARGQQS